MVIFLPDNIFALLSVQSRLYFLAKMPQTYAWPNAPYLTMEIKLETEVAFRDAPLLDLLFIMHRIILEYVYQFARVTPGAWTQRRNVYKLQPCVELNGRIIPLIYALLLALLTLTLLQTLPLNSVSHSAHLTITQMTRLELACFDVHKAMGNMELSETMTLEFVRNIAVSFQPMQILRQIIVTAC